MFWCVEKRDNEIKSVDNIDNIDTKLFKLGLSIFRGQPLAKQASNYITSRIFELFNNRKYYFSDNDSSNEHKKIKGIENLYLTKEQMKTNFGDIISKP